MSPAAHRRVCSRSGTTSRTITSGPRRSRSPTAAHDPRGPTPRQFWVWVGMLQSRRAHHRRPPDRGPRTRQLPIGLWRELVLGHNYFAGARAVGCRTMWWGRRQVLQAEGLDRAERRAVRRGNGRREKRGCKPLSRSDCGSCHERPEPTKRFRPLFDGRTQQPADFTSSSTTRAGNHSPARVFFPTGPGWCYAPLGRPARVPVVSTSRPEVRKAHGTAADLIGQRHRGTAIGEFAPAHGERWPTSRR